MRVYVAPAGSPEELGRLWLEVALIGYAHRVEIGAASMRSPSS